jgi:hypothetical protein
LSVEAYVNTYEANIPKKWFDLINN